MLLFKRILPLFVLFIFITACDDSGTEPVDEEEVAEENPDDTNDDTNAEGDAVLVFTKTAGFKHGSITDGVIAIENLGAENDFSVVQTEDTLAFTTENLEKYKLVVFLSTTKDVLDDNQQAVFEKYIQAGGSFMGIHAATDTEYDWPWYGRLVGAYFDGHPSIQDATIAVLDKDHIATKHLPDAWGRNDEWYNFRDINPDIMVLMNLDERSYEGGTNGDNHPIAWYHEFDGGRSFYTAGGHTSDSFEETDFQEHILGGIFWCLKR